MVRIYNDVLNNEMMMWDAGMYKGRKPFKITSKADCKRFLEKGIVNKNYSFRIIDGRSVDNTEWTFERMNGEYKMYVRYNTNSPFYPRIEYATGIDELAHNLYKWRKYINANYFSNER